MDNGNNNIKQVNMIILNMENLDNIKIVKKNGQVKEMVIQDQINMIKSQVIIDKIINLKIMDFNKLNFNLWVMVMVEVVVEVIINIMVNMVNMDQEVEVVIDTTINFNFNLLKSTIYFYNE